MSCVSDNVLAVIAVLGLVIVFLTALAFREIGASDRKSDGRE